MLKAFARIRNFFRERLFGIGDRRRRPGERIPERRVAAASVESEMERVRTVLADIERGDALIEFTSERQRKHDGP